MKSALPVLLVALVLVLAPAAQADNAALCADLANKISQLDESIAANANNRSQQQYLIDSRNTYARTYNELCTGGGGGGGGSAPNYSTGPNRDQAVINGIFGVLRFLEQRDRERRWREEQRRQQQLQMQRYQEEQRRRAQEERERKEREADDLMRKKTPDPFGRESAQGNPFSTRSAPGQDNPFAAAAQPYGGGCQSILRKLKAGGFGACPSIDAGARFCSAETPDAAVRGWCELSVTTCTFDTQACKSQRLREDLTYDRERKKAESDLDEAIKDYKCKTGREKSCQPGN